MTHRVNRRDLMKGSGAAVLAAHSVSWPITSAAAQDADLADDQTLRVGWAGHGSQSMYGPMDLRWGIFVAGLQYATPFLMLEDASVVPYLAKSLTVSDDGMMAVMTIDDRAVWSDGHPVTADDVKAAWEWLTAPANNASANIAGALDGVEGWRDAADGTADSISGLTVLSDRELQITLTAPDPLLPNRLSNTAAMIFSAESASADTGYFLKANPLVNGPYQITSLDPTGRNGVLSLNPNWWGDVAPVIQSIESTVFEDQQSMVIALENGQIDIGQFTDQVLASRTGELIDGSNLTILAPGGTYASFRVGIEPVDDINVRRALIHAIDYDAMVNVATEGLGTPWRSGFPSAYPCFDPASESYFSYDVDLAKSYLEQSAYGTGGNVPKIRMTPNTTNAQVNRMFQIMQEQWRVNLDITDVEINQQPSGFGDEESLLAIDRQSASARPMDTALFAKNFFHSNSLAATQFMGGYANPDVDRLVDQAYELDRDDPQYCELLHQAETLFLDDAQFIPLSQSERPIWGVVQSWLLHPTVSPWNLLYGLWASEPTAIAQH